MPPRSACTSPGLDQRQRYFTPGGARRVHMTRSKPIWFGMIRLSVLSTVTYERRERWGLQLRQNINEDAGNIWKQEGKKHPCNDTDISTQLPQFL